MEEVKVDPGRMDAKMKLEPHKTPKELSRLLGLVGYNWHFILNFSYIEIPLTLLTWKRFNFIQEKTQEEDFVLLKQKLCNAPVLFFYLKAYDFIIYIDASNEDHDCILMQRGKVITYALR